MGRDAFGREQNEDTLENMGWASGGEVPDTVATPQAPLPGTAPIQTAPPSPAPIMPSGPAVPTTAWSPPAVRIPDFSGSQRRGGGAIAAIFGVVVLGAVVFAVIGIAGSATKIHLPSIPKPDIGTSANPPHGLDAKSMLRRGNLAPALKKIEGAVGGRPRLLRIEAERIDMQVLSGGKLVNVQYRWDSDSANVLSSTPLPTGLPTFSWSQINASAPARLVRATTSAGRAADFEYAVLLQAAGLRWTAYTATKGGFLADPKGRGVKPIGG